MKKLLLSGSKRTEGSKCGGKWNFHTQMCWWVPSRFILHFSPASQLISYGSSSNNAFFLSEEPPGSWNHHQLCKSNFLRGATLQPWPSRQALKRGILTLNSLNLIFQLQTPALVWEPQISLVFQLPRNLLAPQQAQPYRSKDTNFTNVRRQICEVCNKFGTQGKLISSHRGDRRR